MRWLVAFATVLTIAGILFGYYVVLPAALKFLTSYDDNLYNIQIRAKDYYNFVSLVLLAVAVVFQVPLFILGLVRIGVTVLAQAAQELADRNRRSMTALAVALPGVDPVTTLLEMVPLISLYLLSLALSGFFERRWRPATAARGAMTEVSADWVLPVDGPPIHGGRVRFEDGAIVEVGPGRAERHFEDAAIVPGFVNAHSHLEYSLYAGFGDGQAFGPWIATHVERKNGCRPEDMLALARRGVADSLRSGITTTADYSFSGAAATAAAELGLRAIVYLEVFARDPAVAARSTPEKRARIAGVAARDGSASRPTRRTRARSRSTGGACRSASRSARTSPSRRARTSGSSDGTGPLEGIAPLLVPPTGRTRRRDARAGARARPPLRPLRRGRRRARSRSSPRATCRSPTARARTRCSAAASRRSPSCAPQG